VSSDMPEWKEKLFAEFIANRAWQEKLDSQERFAEGEFLMDLVRTDDDPGEGDPAFQEELRRFCADLHAAGIPYGQRAIAMDAVDALGFPLPQFVVAMKALGPPVISGLAGYAAAWVQARNGRKVRIRIGEIEAEARSISEIETLLKKAAEFQDRDRPSGDE
jgi:hypothetical protein